MWKKKPKTKETLEKYRMEKCREEGEKQQIHRQCFVPYKNPKFERGLVKVMKKGGSMEDES